MKSSTTKKFRDLLQKLPETVQIQAHSSYDLWQHDQYHPSLHFKQINPNLPIYSVRIGMSYRALGRLRDNHIYWFWIGHHSKYDELLKRLWCS